MQKKDILEKSRNENKNKDLVDIEISAQAGNIAGRVGACVCCLISLIFYWITNTPLLSPWIIYFSILGTHYLVKYIKINRKSDLVITILYFAMCLLALFFFGMKLMGFIILPLVIVGLAFILYGQIKYNKGIF